MCPCPAFPRYFGVQTAYCVHASRPRRVSHLVPPSLCQRVNLRLGEGAILPFRLRRERSAAYI
eukprot:scaffold141988_cov30-Tisochrysis_lutea.AAC.1